MTQLLGFARFEVGRLVRSWKFLIITLGFPVIFYMLFLRDRSAHELIGGTVSWRAYLMVSMCSFGSLVAGLTAAGGRLSAERASGWTRHLKVTPIPSWSYVVTKVGACMLVTLPVIALIEVVGVGFGGVRLDPATWAELTLLLWATALPFAVLGVLVGFVVNTETAFPVVVALMFVLGYFGGLFNPVETMPHPMEVAAHVLPNFHQAALGIALLDGRALGLDNWLILGAYVLVLTAGVTAKHHLEEARGSG